MLIDMFALLSLHATHNSMSLLSDLHDDISIIHPHPVETILYWSLILFLGITSPILLFSSWWWSYLRPFYTIHTLVTSLQVWAYGPPYLMRWEVALVKSIWIGGVLGGGGGVDVIRDWLAHFGLGKPSKKRIAID